MRKISKEEKEKRTVRVFLKNRGEAINQEDIIKLQEDRIIDIIIPTKNKKFQVRFLDDELISKLFRGEPFMGERNFDIIKQMIKKALKKESHYSPCDVKDVILLLDAFELFSLLDLSKDDHRIARQICSDADFIKNKNKKIFKEIYIVGNKFNIKIK